MATAQVKLNAVSPSVTAKSKSQPVKTDTSFSDILNKENNISGSKGGSKESKTNNIVSEKYFKESGKTPVKADKSTGSKVNEKVYAGKNATANKAKDAAEKNFVEEPENGEEQDEKVKNLMAILANIIAGISQKTGTDEAAVKDFIAENNLTSENLLDINSWKGFVTEVNGLDNISAILTNDEAFRELNDISEMLDKYLDEMGQMTAGMTEGVTDEGEKGVRLFSEEGIKLDELLEKSKNVLAGKEAGTEETVEKDTEEMSVIMPLMTDENGIEAAHTKSGFEQNSRSSQGEKQNASAEVTGISSQNLFDNIAANLQKLEGAGSLPEGTTAKAILEQVTNQIHNLHAPDKTSLEFMLTPETLGKVAVNVSSKNGVLQAEFRVESAQAKAALESQMVELKLNFENQGLKVESVSVMISENGIGNDDGNRNTGEEGKRNNKRNRNFDIEEGIESISVSPEEAIRLYTNEDTGSNINLGA